MSDQSQGPGWWQASDGKWYPPESARSSPPSPPPPSNGATPGRDARRSMMMLAFVPVSLIGGLVVGSILLGDPNSPDSPQRWAAVPGVVLLWAMIEVPAVLGMFWGRRAMKAGDPSGRRGLALNAAVFAFFTLTTLVGGTVDAFNGV